MEMRKSESLKSYFKFQPREPYLRRSLTIPWKKDSPKNSFLNGSGFELARKNSFSAFEFSICWYVLISDDLIPLGGSLVNFMLLCNMERGKSSLLMEVSHNLKSG